MTHHPFTALTVAPKLSARHKKHTPISPPLLIVFAVNLFEDGNDLGAVGVHILKPSLGGFLIMTTINLPMLFNLKAVLKVKQQIIGRHDPAGEEIFGDPVRLVLFLIKICEFAMREDVDEQLTVVFNKSCHFFQ